MNPNPPNLFTPGCQPGPGRPKGSVGGRAQAIALIDSIITENGDKLRAALETEFHKNPVRFWTRYGFPLVPQSLVAKVETTSGGSPWISLLEATRLREVEKLAEKAGLPLPPPVRRAGPPWGDRPADFSPT